MGAAQVGAAQVGALGAVVLSGGASTRSSRKRHFSDLEMSSCSDILCRKLFAFGASNCETETEVNRGANNRNI